jgi:hypothetical protein
MLGMVAHACSPSTGGTEVEGCNLEDNLSYIVRPCLKKKKRCPGQGWLTLVILATGGRDLKDHVLRPAQAESWQGPILSSN